MHLLDVLDWFNAQHFFSPSHLLAKTSVQPLKVLCWSLQGTSGTISVCLSTFLYAALLCLPKPFDPFPKAPEESKYWSDNGSEWFSWPLLTRTLLVLKLVQRRWVNPQLLAFPLLYFDFVLLCQTKVDASLLSVPCQVNRFFVSCCTINKLAERGREEITKNV